MQFRKVTVAYFESDRDRNLQMCNAVNRHIETGGAYVGKHRL
jgi:hypothetical protein